MRDSTESVPQNSRRPTLASTKYSMRLTSLNPRLLSLCKSVLRESLRGIEINSEHSILLSRIANRYHHISQVRIGVVNSRLMDIIKDVAEGMQAFL